MKVVFMGTPQAAVPSLERLLADGYDVVAVYTQPDRPSGRGNKISYSPVKQVAIDANIAVYQPTKIKAPETIETFCSHAADVVVVVAYGRILPRAYLTAFSPGAINVHFSLLPKYRGAAPVNWAIANGETETGVTTMQMDEGLDTGPILLQSRTEIVSSENAVDLMQRLAAKGADLLSHTLSQIESLIPEPQQHQYATFAPIMKKDDGLIDWSNRAIDISNRVRGFQPFPTSFSFFRGKKVTLWKAFPSSKIDRDAAEPGEIVKVHGDVLIVRCGHGSDLRIDEIQPEGKRRMSGRDFINGFRPMETEIFGQ